MRGKGARALRATVTAAVAGVLSLAPSTARAADTTAHELKYDLAADLSVIGGSLVLVVGSELIPGIKPQRCRWCDRDDDGNDTLNGLDRSARRALLWRDPRRAQADSNVVGFAITPAVLALDMFSASASDGALRALPVDFLVIGESAMVSMVLNQTAKIAFARERPFVHHMPAEERAKTAHPSDNDVSFYSGHSSLTFSLATASGTVASLRGYRLAPLVWSTLLPLAALTGYLRIAGDKHYLTDVVTGALIGSAVGVVMPLLFHGRREGAFVPGGDEGGRTPGAAALPLRAAPQMITIGGGF